MDGILKKIRSGTYDKTKIVKIMQVKNTVHDEILFNIAN